MALNADGSFVYTPTANYSGTDTFTYLANDGKLSSNIATVTITVDPVAVTPTVSDISYAVLREPDTERASAGILLNDTYPSGTPTITVVNGPLNDASFTLNQDGSFSYTPATNYFGSDSVTYYIESDGLLSGLATVSLTISLVPVAPTATNVSYTTNENSVLTIAAPAYWPTTSIRMDCRSRPCFRPRHLMARSC